MPVPCPPNAIAMSAINTELGLSSTASNSSLSTRASQTGGYVAGAPNIQFSEFCGFSYLNYNTFEINDTGYSSDSEACNFGGQDNLTLYFSGSGGTPGCPSISQRVYTDSGLTTLFDGANRWYKSNYCNASYYILGAPSNTGIVEASTGC